MSFRVLRPGACSLLVDGGRPGTRSLGVPVGGAADRSAWRLGNALLGNDPILPALEIALSGPCLIAEASIGCVVFGAPFEIWHNGTRRAPNRSFTLNPGDELAIGATALGMRAYLCVVGGFDGTELLGSRSALAPIQAGETLPCRASRARGRFLTDAILERPSPSAKRGTQYPDRWSSFPSLGARARTDSVSTDSARTDSAVLRITPGKQRDGFDVPAFLANTYTVGQSSNRMGLRLEGPPIVAPSREMVSEPVCPGSIQVTREGQAIVLGVDGQTIGGYPKIGQVVSADLDLLGQLRSGQSLSFQMISHEEALTLYRAREEALGRALLRLRASLDSAWVGRTLLEDRREDEARP